MSQADFSELAEGDLAEIWVSIAKGDIDTADRFLAELRDLANRLAALPLMGIARPELGNEVRSFVHGEYLMIYRPQKQGVAISRVAHGRRDLRRLVLPRS